MVVASAMLKTLAGTVIFEFVLIKLLLSPATKVYAPVLLEVDIPGKSVRFAPLAAGRVAGNLASGMVPEDNCDASRFPLKLAAVMAPANVADPPENNSMFFEVPE